MADDDPKQTPVLIVSDSKALPGIILSKLRDFADVSVLSFDAFLQSFDESCRYTDNAILIDIAGIDSDIEISRYRYVLKNSILIAIISDVKEEDPPDIFKTVFDEIIYGDEIGLHLKIRIEKAIINHKLVKNSYIKKISILEKFNSIISDLNKELHIEKLLSKSIDSLKGILGVEKASILLFEDEELIVKACIGLPGTVKSGFKSLRKDSISYFVAKNRESIIVNDIEKEDRFKYLKSGTDYKKSSFISTPIMFYDTVIGVINLNDKIGRDFTEDDLELLKVFASHLAINIVNAHLFLDLKDKAATLLQVNREKDKLNRKISMFNEILKSRIEEEKEKLKSAYQELLNRDDILQKKILELMSLKKAGKTAISELFNLELVLDVILNIALREVDALRGSIVIKDKTGELIVKAAAGEAKDIVNTRVSNEDSVTHYILKKGESLLVTDIEKDPVFKKADITGKYNTKSLLSLPLKAGDQIYGIMNVNNKHNKRPFNSDDLDILSGLANQASMAIHNFYLSEKLRERELSLQQAEKMAEIGSLVVAVAHELRNPLGILRTNIEFLREITGDNKDIFDNMVSQINRARRFIKDLMQFGKPTNLNFVSSNIIDVMELSINHAISDYKGIEDLNIEREYSDGIINLNIDPMKIQQVFINLLINSLDELKFVSDPKIIIRIYPEESYVNIEVEDNGSGVSNDIMNYIFNPFFSSKKGGGGTGLGLSIAKRIIEMHGGQINLDSNRMQGAKFHVLLPV